MTDTSMSLNFIIYREGKENLICADLCSYESFDEAKQDAEFVELYSSMVDHLKIDLKIDDGHDRCRIRIIEALLGAHCLQIEDYSSPNSFLEHIVGVVLRLGIESKDIKAKDFSKLDIKEYLKEHIRDGNEHDDNFVSIMNLCYYINPCFLISLFQETLEKGQELGRKLGDDER